jgi:SAM-dependent methyltransferase
MRSSLPELTPELMQRASFFPHRPEAHSYCLANRAGLQGAGDCCGVAVPPQALWVNYGRSAEEYLESGREDMARMRDVLAGAGKSFECFGRVLEFGCGAGRMIRWLAEFAGRMEIWGNDVWSSAVMWCNEHLNPPFHFVTTTVTPHLPFADGYFDFIYAGSVFTHIDDLADAWFLELRRILTSGGCLYFTVNDRSALALVNSPEGNSERYYRRSGGEQMWSRFWQGIKADPAFQHFISSDCGMVSIGRSTGSHVFYDRAFLTRKLTPFYRTLSVTDKAYGHQTGILLERV